MDNFNFNITDQAAKRINELLLNEEDKDMKLRIEVLGGGCSGYQYNMDFTNLKQSDDYLFDKDGATVVIDEVSMKFLNNSVLDYITNLVGASFEIKNPSATSTCGCGNSFSV